MNKEREKKYLVIGSSGHQFVESIEWETDPLPNLVDYDVIIANVRSLTEDYLQNIPSDKIELIRKLLVRFLKSFGTLIILSDHYKRGTNKNRYPETYDNYSWCPIHIGIAKESGNIIEEKVNPFPKYFSKFKRWEYYFYVPQSCLTIELTNQCGATYDYTYTYQIEPYLKNREQRTLAGSYHWWTEAEQTTGAHPKKEVELGPIVLLPLLKEFDSRESTNILLEDILGKPQVSLPPSWVDNVKIPPITDINTKIAHHAGTIKKHQEEIDKLDKQKKDLEYYKKLLYADGRELEDVFKKCLLDLGASVTPAKYAEEEYCLQYQKNDYPVEAKGNTKSISLTNLRQLMDYLLIYDEKTGKQNKGILLGNAWKHIPVNKRNEHGKPTFPSNVIQRAEATNIALVSSVDFFNAFCEFLENKSLGKKILDHIINQTGVVSFKTIKKPN